MSADFNIENHGTIFLVRPVSAAGVAWLATTAPDEAQFWGDAMVVEHRYIRDVAEVIVNAGLEVS